MCQGAKIVHQVFSFWHSEENDLIKYSFRRWSVTLFSQVSKRADILDKIPRIEF